MARFCTSCGSPVEESLKFCTKCGSPVAALTPAPASAPPAQAAATPTAGGGVVTPGPPAAKSGSPLLKIMLIVVGILILLGILGIGSCVYIAYKAKQRASALIESAKTTSPGEGTPEVHLGKGGEGTSAAASVTAEVPPYPGSTPTEEGGQLSFGGGAISGQEFETPDPVEKVVAFYKEKLGSKLRIQESGGNAVLTLMSARGMTTVAINREERAGKTKINITRLGK